MEEQAQDNYTVRPFPRMRRFSIDAGRLGRRRNMMNGLFEVDVTTARQAIAEHRARTAESLSFTAFVIACLAQAIVENREVQAWRDWRGRLVIYDDVNVNTMIEVQAAKGAIVMPHIVRAANRKTFRAIHDEIRAAQHEPARTQELRFMSIFLWLPGPLRRALEAAFMRFPQHTRRLTSPVLVSSVGMFGTGAFWGLPLANFPLSVTLGGIVERPRLVDGRLENREVLCVTLSVDHEIVDGAAAVRAAQRFRELAESGYGLV